MRTVAFKTFGCRLNQAETAQFEAEFAAAGFTRVPLGALARVIVIHSCAVTQRAENEGMKLLRALRSRVFDAENEQRRQRSMKAAADKAAAEQAASAGAQAKPAKTEDLSDENINRLVDADPSEAERLIKLRQKQDPTYKPARQP